MDIDEARVSFHLPNEINVAVFLHGESRVKGVSGEGAARLRQGSRITNKKRRDRVGSW